MQWLALAAFVLQIMVVLLACALTQAQQAALLDDRWVLPRLMCSILDTNAVTGWLLRVLPERNNFVFSACLQRGGGRDLGQEETPSFQSELQH